MGRGDSVESVEGGRWSKTGGESGRVWHEKRAGLSPIVFR